MRLFVIILSIMWLPIPGLSTASDKLSIIILDVDEGQAVLLVSGEEGILIDTGHFGRAGDTVKSIRGHGVKKLDLLLLTHLHPDHASGVLTVMDEFPDAVIYESGHRIPYHQFNDACRWVAEALDSDKWKVRKLGKGDSIKWKGAVLKILWPLKPAGDDLNSQSLVIVIEYCDGSAVIMGDVGKDVEKILIDQLLLPENIDILVVGHHGAGDATGDALLERLRPRYGAISVDRNNIRGYPSKEVFEKLRKYGVKHYATYEAGDIVFPLCHQAGMN